jgi:hypothetical protein
MGKQEIYYIKGSPRLKKFIEAFAAAAGHLNRAYEKRSALECIVLSAVLIDAQLRIGIIMKDQLAQGTDNIDETLLHQSDDEKKRSEREIIKMALDRGLVNDTGYRNLSELYDQRNKCIHRYIISDINYQYVTSLVFKYADALDKVREAVEYVESVQYAQGIGLVKARGDGKEYNFKAEFKKWIKEMADSKDSRPNSDG